MTIQGVRLSDNFVTDARPKDWREGILLLFPNGKAPLFALTAGMSKRVTRDPEFNWWEKSTPNAQRLTLDATELLNNTDTTTTLAIGTTSAINNALIAGIRAGTVMRLEETDELVRVTTDPVSGDGNLVVARGWSGSTKAALDADGAGVNPNLHSLGNVREENSAAPGGVSFDPVKKSNFTQIFRDTLEMSRTAQKTRLRTGDQVREAKRETLEIHSVGIEKALWFGKLFEAQTINGRVARTTGGIYQYLLDNAAGNIVSANSGAVAGNIELEDFEVFMEQAFRFGSNEKMGFCGNQALLAIQQMARKNANFELVQGQKEFGMNISRLVSPFGTIVLKTHPLFNQHSGGTTTAVDYFAINSWLFILDMENFSYRFLEDSDTQFQPKLQTNGLDGVQSGYLTECGLEIHHATSHFLIKNLNKGVVDV